MSKYNRYAKDLDLAFTGARKIFTDAYTKLQRAAAAYDEARHRTQPGENEWHISRAKADYLTAKADFEEVNARVWAALKDRRTELTKALRAEVDAASVADPAAVDVHALELMRSGVMSVADYNAFAERYADNGTMRRLVAHYAQKAADSTQDARERGMLSKVVRSCEDSTMQSWETLCGIMDHCAGGRPGRYGDPEHVSGMSAKWEELTHDTIEGF